MVVSHNRNRRVKMAMERELRLKDKELKGMKSKRVPKQEYINPRIIFSDRILEDDWKAFKVKMEDYAKNFLEKYYPTVVVDFDFRLLDQKLDKNLNGQHTALYSYFGDHDNYIYLSDWMVHASIYCDDFSIVVPTLSHELVHYALFKLGKGHRDGQNDFEKELERIGLPSNYNRKFMAIHVFRKEESGKTIAEIYVDKNEQSKPSLGMEKIIKRA